VAVAKYHPARVLAVLRFETGPIATQGAGRAVLKTPLPRAHRIGLNGVSLLSTCFSYWFSLGLLMVVGVLFTEPAFELVVFFE